MIEERYPYLFHWLHYFIFVDQKFKTLLIARVIYIYHDIKIKLVIIQLLRHWPSINYILRTQWVILGY